MKNYIDVIEIVFPLFCLGVGVGTAIWYEVSVHKERKKEKDDIKAEAKIIELGMQAVDYKFGNGSFDLAVEHRVKEIVKGSIGKRESAQAACVAYDNRIAVIEAPYHVQDMKVFL